MQGGAIEFYHERVRNLRDPETETAITSGSFALDKFEGQVQRVTPTAAMTLTGFSNFSSNSTNPGTTDTVTLVVAQGATGYAVNLPAASSTIKYAGGVNTVGTTADSVTMIAITAIGIGASVVYLIAVSPEFV